MKLQVKLPVWLKVLIVVIGLGLAGCQEDVPSAPENTWAEPSVEALVDLDKQAAGAYPQHTWRTYQYRNPGVGYAGGNMKVNGGSTFHLEDGALIPPPEIPWGENVRIDMIVEKDKSTGEMIFTFRPHGCQFDPPAEVWFDWKDLHVDLAKLYYIDENGNRILQTPDDIDLQGKRMKLYIHHFSRYALSSE